MENRAPYNATLPVAAISPIDDQLSPTEWGLIRAARKARNEIASPFGQAILTVIIRPKGKTHSWYVAVKEQNARESEIGN
jgi:hypothetical protein